MKEQLESIKMTLISQLQTAMGNIQNVDAHELGEVVDMIKDIEEALYYCTITKAMDKKEEESQTNNYYYTERMYPYYDRYRDMDKDYGKLYYDGNNGGNSGNNASTSNSSSSGQSSTSHYFERPYPMAMRDSREGRSPMSRRNYMETKQMHGDKKNQMQELEQYLQELSSDITEMISDSSQEEKTLLQSKLMALANKI